MFLHGDIKSNFLDFMLENHAFILYGSLDIFNISQIIWGKIFLHTYREAAKKFNSCAINTGWGKGPAIKKKKNAASHM